MDEDEEAGTTRGRFRVSSAGPPETTLGRFRLIPQGSPYATYGPTSPCLQRGRFAVIPEEPHAGSPAQGSDKVSARESPSIEWDFDEKSVNISGRARAFFSTD
ncbi:uncharacterized protein DMENIID0001_101520 [Sergentomyia squamirostris]